MLLALAGIVLVACSSQDSYDWLEGYWTSSEWQVTYELGEEDGVWTIRDGSSVLAQSAKLSTDKDKNIVLTDTDGMQFIIEKISDSQIHFQQVAAEGLQGRLPVRPLTRWMINIR
ncbi:membrane lipoprotein lipid attachment site-containing protein [Streptococcus caprae]|uniref:Aldo/keto reductase n=1 Tax=Streptococcus caprae TaxID=1640501 RepID=A0ABV8CVB4_9STRE